MSLTLFFLLIVCKFRCEIFLLKKANISNSFHFQPDFKPELLWLSRVLVDILVLLMKLRGENVRQHLLVINYLDDSFLRI